MKKHTNGQKHYQLLKLSIMIKEAIKPGQKYHMIGNNNINQFNFNNIFNMNNRNISNNMNNF